MAAYAIRHTVHGINLAINFYRNSRKLSLREPLKNQFHRASLSIVRRLAEKSAKPTAKERRKFYRISLG